MNLKRLCLSGRRKFMWKILLLVPLLLMIFSFYYFDGGSKSNTSDLVNNAPPAAKIVKFDDWPAKENKIVNIDTHEKTAQEKLKDDVSQSKSKHEIHNERGVIQAPQNSGGFGEMGVPVILPKDLDPETKKKVDEGWKKNAFNQYVSDMISVRRTLPDPRDEWCKDPKRFSSNLPETSVIICFHNEAWSVLLRTVHSVIDRSPPHLVKEIILVDDFSDMSHLKQQLESYISKYPQVRIVRLDKREGLIRARIAGARHATAKTLTFLDSHCECATGWLPPLLSPIQEDPTTVAAPIIEVIGDDTFEFKYQSDPKLISIGGFDWSLQFNWHTVPEREKKRHKHPAEPIASPTMAGGLFTIDKAYFEKLGSYDPGFDIWGGENLELSFKTWMCGGTLVTVPCSHVGHVFRKRSPYSWGKNGNVLRKNLVRLAEVWLDDHKKYYYERIGYDLGDFGDVSARKKLRKDLGCKSFKWYLNNIYPELFVPGDSVASGEIRNMVNSGRLAKCLDSPAQTDDLHKPVGLWPCHNQGGNQFWMLSKEGEIRRDEACMDYAGEDVILYPCHGSKGNQLWEYDPEKKRIRHGTSGKCMALSVDKKKIEMLTCDSSNKYQNWKFENYDASKRI